jgi:hypothetical protein
MSAARRRTHWRSKASKGDAEDEGAHFRHPESASISCVMTAATMRDSRRALELSPSGPGGWYGRAIREFSSLDQLLDQRCDVARTGHLLCRDSCFPPTTHLARARLV